MVPKGWDVKKIDSFCNVTSSKRIMQSDYVESGIPFYRSKEIILKSKGIEPADIIYIETDKFYQLKKKFGAPQEGDILISAVGTLGVSYLVKNNEEFYFKDGNLLWLRKLSGIEQSFLIQLMKSSYFQNEIQNMTAGSSQKALTIEKLSRMKLLSPPLREQQKIAKILATWDKAISTTERLIDNSTQQKKALMQQLLKGKKRLLDESGKSFEGEWERLKLEDIVIKTQLGTSERTKDVEETSTIPLIKMGNLTWGGFSFDKLETLPKSKVDESLILKNGDFLFNTRNTPELVGKSAVWKEQQVEATFDNNINRITFNRNINTDFMCLYLTYGKGKSLISSLSAGSTSVAAIYWKDLKNIKLKIPTLSEQQKIATVLTNADKEIELLEQQLTDLQQEKKALMQVLLTGKKRVVVDGELK